MPAAAQTMPSDQGQASPADTVPAAPAALGKAITVSGSAAEQTDYRLRGVSQSDRNPAIQGSLTIVHRSGFYVGTFASNLAGWSTFGGSNLEIDAIGGFKHSFGTATLNAGLTWYMYPGGANKTDDAELFGNLSGTAGSVTLLAGVAYAPSQQALGKGYDNGAEAAAGTYAIKGTPLTVNLSWIDTGISRRRAAYLQPSFSKGQDGTGSIAGSTIFASLTAAF